MTAVGAAGLPAGGFVSLYEFTHLLGGHAVLAASIHAIVAVDELITVTFGFADLVAFLAIVETGVVLVVVPWWWWGWFG